MLSGTVPHVSFGDYLKGLPDHLLLREAIGLYQGDIPDPKSLMGFSESHLRETLTVDEPTFRRFLAFRVLYDRMANSVPAPDQSLRTRDDLVALSKSALPGWHVVTADREGSILSVSRISPPDSGPVRDFVREALRSALLHRDAGGIAIVSKNVVADSGVSGLIDDMLLHQTGAIGIKYLGSCETSPDGSLLRFGPTLLSGPEASREADVQDPESEEDPSDVLGGPR